jgi:hypothetical protein
LNVDVDDIEEIKYSGDDASDLNQPDVYIPNTGESNIEMDPEMSKDDKIDTGKWAMPSPQKHQNSSCDIESKLDQNNEEECNNSTNEELMVKLPPLKNKDSLTEDTNKGSEQSNSPKPDISPENSTTNNFSISETVGEELTVKLPPVSQGATNEVKCDGAESSDSLKQDKTDSVNNRSQSPMNDSSDSLEGVYQIKWAKFKGKDVPIITQNENGPCPLLAIMNVLLLKGKIKFTSDTEIISSEQMMAHLGECILADKPQVNVFLAHLGECILTDKPQVNVFSHLGERILADKPQVKVFLAYLGEYILADKPQVNGLICPSGRLYIYIS